MKCGHLSLPYLRKFEFWFNVHNLMRNPRLLKTPHEFKKSKDCTEKL